MQGADFKQQLDGRYISFCFLSKQTITFFKTGFLPTATFMLAHLPYLLHAYSSILLEH